jgi:hypothetical protein
MKYLFILFSFAIVTISDAQTPGKKTGGFRFASQLNANLLEGGSGPSSLFTAVVGVRKKDWFAGLGGGSDHYYIRSIPVFASAARYFKTGKNNFLLQGQAGLNFEARRHFFPDPGNNVISDEFKPGLFWGGNFGFAKTLGKKHALLFNVGYSYKQLHETIEYNVFCISPPCAPQKETYNYHLRRLSVGLSWLFGG